MYTFITTSTQLDPWHREQHQSVDTWQTLPEVNLNLINTHFWNQQFSDTEDNETR